MRLLRDAGTVLEICPTSNLLTKALPDEDAVRDTFRAFVEHGVAFTIATDGPEMMHTHLRDELELLERIGALTPRSSRPRTARGHEASFIRAEESHAARARCVRVDMAARSLEAPDRALDRLPRLGLDLRRDQALGADAAGVPLRRAPASCSPARCSR